MCCTKLRARSGCTALYFTQANHSVQVWALPHDGQGAGGGERLCRVADSWALVDVSGRF